MKNIIAIVQRELGTYFVSPVAYVVLTIFLFVTGMFFQAVLSQVLRASMMQAMQSAQMGGAANPIDVPAIVSQNFLSSTSVILLFIIPMITMALFSEEKKRGTIELMLTAPVTDAQFIFGKFLAAGSFFAILLLATWIPMGALYVFGHPASGPILTAYLGLLLYSLSLVAIGMFISSLTENQIVAGVLSFGVFMMLWLVTVLANRAEDSSKAVLSYLSILDHLDDFLKGVLSTSNVIFYLSLIFVGVFLTYRSVDSLRWRG
jgi:ABC-2 type transport system permease protein